MQQHGSKYFARSHLPDPPLPSPWGCGQKVKIELFQNMVMLDIKLKSIMNAAKW